jgi:hypothetical protein
MGGIIRWGLGIDMKQAVKSSRIMTGDFVGSAWRSSPELTPYGQAIVDHYPIQTPWFLTKTVTVNGLANFPRVVQITSPYLYDVLIVGMSALVPDDGLSLVGLPFLSLQVTHQETGIPWVTPNLIGYSPLAAFAGINLNPTPIIKLPEAFFLPKHTLLRLEWTIATNQATGLVNAVTTLVGIQLANHRTGFTAPERVTMPNGESIRVGDRLPWFCTVPFGRKTGQAFGDFALLQDQQVLQFLPPSDCDVEIHDAYANFSDESAVGNLELMTMKLTDMRSRSDWTPGLSPATAILGNERQVYPALPFTKPHILKKGHRTALTLQSNDPNFAVTSGSVTLRGVRRCEY